jgi:uncharacterized membrane protein YphA (DoxX/SURF4 family)
MNDTLLWIAQGILAFAFLAASAAKLTKSRAELQEAMPFVEDFSDPTVTLIASLELMGAIGVIVPWATGILPILTPLAAAGLAATMVGAAITHLARREFAPLPLNAALLAVAAYVVLGRWPA